MPVELDKPHQKFTQVSLKAPVQLDPYQTKFVPVTVPETPESTLLMYPQPRFCHHSHPFIANVTSEQSIYVPLVNSTKKRKTFRKGTIVASYEEVKVPPSDRVNATRRRIHNDLLPQNDTTSKKGTCVQRLGKLIKQQNWGHLSPSERTELETLILENDSLFILSENELGLISGPPGHIRVSDPQPCRGPRYQYPEQAKQIIAEMLEDMEKKGITEPSTAVWLSPIVFVNKPNGSKCLCLDYRQVNKHLATDIYPLPRLEELVDQAAGHKYYVTLDMREAYFQLLLDDESRDITTFSDGVTLYRFKRLPSGLNCSPAIFSRRMASLLAPLLRKGWVKNYLDDLINPSAAIGPYFTLPLRS